MKELLIKKMYAGLEAIANTYQINLGRGHFFEDMILKLGESKDPSSNSNFGDSKAKPGYTYFDFEISKECALELVNTLNSQCPSLMAVDETEKFEKLNGRMNTVNSYVMLPARLIYLRADAIAGHLLPRMAEYLQEHPEVAASYVKFTYNEFLDKVDAELAKYGITCNKTDCFEETICALVNRYFNTSARVFNLFQSRFPGDAKPFPDALQKMSLDYLGVKEAKSQEEDVELVTTTSRFNKSGDEWSTYLYITTPMAQAKKIETYFNQLQPNSAQLSAKPTSLTDKPGLSFSKILIANSVLMQEKFWLHFNDAMQSYSRQKIENYRKQSQSITKTTSECLDEFAEVDKIIAALYKEKDFSETQRLLIMKLLLSMRDLEAQIRAEYKETTLSSKLAQCIATANQHLASLKMDHGTHPAISNFFANEAQVMIKLLGDISDLVTNKFNLPPVYRDKPRKPGLLSRDLYNGEIFGMRC